MAKKSAVAEVSEVAERARKLASDAAAAAQQAATAAEEAASIMMANSRNGALPASTRKGPKCLITGGCGFTALVVGGREGWGGGCGRGGGGSGACIDAFTSASCPTGFFAEAEACGGGGVGFGVGFGGGSTAVDVRL